MATACFELFPLAVTSWSIAPRIEPAAVRPSSLNLRLAASASLTALTFSSSTFARASAISCSRFKSSSAYFARISFSSLSLSSSLASSNASSSSSNTPCCFAASKAALNLFESSPLWIMILFLLNNHQEPFVHSLLPLQS